MTLSLVTGASGFVGQHLIAELLRGGERVVGAVLGSPPELATLPPEQAERVVWVEADLERPEDVRRLLAENAVNKVFHLAAVTSVEESHSDPAAAFSVNVIGTLHLLRELTEARGRMGRDLRVVISGSAEVYGSAASRCRPLNEDCPLEPLNTYAVSKAAQELLGLQFQRAHGLPVVVARSFNHTGPGQLPPFVAPQLASQIVAARNGDAACTIKVGNPEIRRDFTDVRDVVKAYILLAERGVPGQVYNVCSGRSYAIGELIQLLGEIAGIEVRMELDPERKRAVDVLEMVGDCSRLHAATGWEAQIAIRETLSGLLDSLQTAGSKEAEAGAGAGA